MRDIGASNVFDVVLPMREQGMEAGALAWEGGEALAISAARHVAVSGFTFEPASTAGMSRSILAVHVLAAGASASGAGAEHSVVARLQLPTSYGGSPTASVIRGNVTASMVPGQVALEGRAVSMALPTARVQDVLRSMGAAVIEPALSQGVVSSGDLAIVVEVCPVLTESQASCENVGTAVARASAPLRMTSGPSPRLSLVAGVRPALLAASGKA